MDSIKTIGIVFNLKKKGCSDDRYEEFDEPETIERLKDEIEKYGFTVILFEQNDSLATELVKGKPDFVFNIAEGFGNARGRESQVPCILESIGIPYSGSDPIALGISLDKYLTHVMLNAAKIPVPIMYMIKTESEIKRLSDIFSEKPRFIVKPRWEGSSKGIFLNSVVDNFSDLRERVRFVLSEYHQPALVEEFLEKDEITVGVCGNNADVQVLGMMRIVHTDSSQPFFLYSIENKREWETKIKYESEGTIPVKIHDTIKKYAVQAFSALELRDFARVDFRLDKNNVPKIIDINPLPGLSPYYSDLPILYKLKGNSYELLVKTLLEAALKRYGISLKEESACGA